MRAKLSHISFARRKEQFIVRWDASAISAFLEVLGARIQSLVQKT